ncbi:MAG: flagellar basal-body rod protein FlgF [Phycisphaerae bacterium]|nr:flagellar basal-body rod protein FlgF [Phycisphaerae bacterium]
MSNAMEITGPSLAALTKQYRVIANNLANANTVGYKRQVSRFHHAMTQAMGNAGGMDGAGNISTILNKIALDFTQGPLNQTNRKLDVAIEGKGFFVIETAQGPFYTRNGAFRVNDKGSLVDGLGRNVAGKGGPISVPNTVGLSKLNIARDGTISAGDKDLGKLKVVEFEDVSILKRIGAGCFAAPPTTKPKPASDINIHQGYQELANVSAVEELVKLIRVSRLYEAGVKSMNSHDERLQSLLRVASG